MVFPKIHQEEKAPSEKGWEKFHPIKAKNISIKYKFLNENKWNINSGIFIENIVAEQQTLVG